ncbi:YdcF family protein [Candidatus Falkowbacteria bacterium]|nr:YdcF family protein [Candidatus Falkowbacteria bacterium]
MPTLLDCITDFIFFEDEPVLADIILIPGALRPQLIDKAVELYKQGLAPYILPSGGVGPKLAKERETGVSDWNSEWEYMRAIALEQGVPEAAILKEDKALHTFDNATLSLQTIGQSDIKVKKAILVCKRHGARRALLTYQTVFPRDIEFIVCPVLDDRNVSADNWFLDEAKVALVMGEVEKIGKYFSKHVIDLAKK